MQKILQFLREYVHEKENGKLPEAELNTRVTALSEMGSALARNDGSRFQEAMTMAHFSTYFADALDRRFYDAYNYQSGEWKNYTHPDTTPDFRDVKRFRMRTPGTLHRRYEKGEIKATYISNTEVHYGVEEFGNQFDVSWQTILNDDLGEIVKTPDEMGKAAGRFEDQFVSALYDNATTQGTLAAMGAPWAGTGRLTVPNLAIAINAFAVRPDAAGNLMNIKRVYLVLPPVLRIQAGQILKDLLQYGGPAGNNLADYIAGVYFDPYIATAGANVPWYMFADPKEIPAVTVARLQGVPGPWTWTEQSNVRVLSGSAPAPFALGSSNTGNIVYGVETVIGGWDDASLVGVTDFRGIWYSSGTTA